MKYEAFSFPIVLGAVLPLLLIINNPHVYRIALDNITIETDEVVSEFPFRDVAPEAQAFHDHAREFGLPMPFDILPVREEDLDWVEGYGANTFSWKKRDFSTYKQTHGYHTGIDYGGVDSNYNEISIPVRAVCDGVVIPGRVEGGNGGSTKFQTGRGFVLRCFMDDPTLMDIDGDGHRNLSVHLTF